LVEQAQQQNDAEGDGQAETEEAAEQENEEQENSVQGQMYTPEQGDGGEYAPEEADPPQYAPSFLTVSATRARLRRRATPTLGDVTLGFLTKDSGTFSQQETKTIQSMETSFWNTIHALRKHNADLLLAQRQLNKTYASQFSLHTRLTTTKTKLEATRNHLRTRVKMLKGALQNLGLGHDQEADNAIQMVPNATRGAL